MSGAPTGGTGGERRSLVAILVAAAVLAILSLMRTVARRRPPPDNHITHDQSARVAGSRPPSVAEHPPSSVSGSRPPSVAWPPPATIAATGFDGDLARAGGSSAGPGMVTTVPTATVPAATVPTATVPTTARVQAGGPPRRPPSVFDSLDSPVETGFRAYKWQAFIAIGTAFFTIVMATTMVFVLLSAIADDFGVTLRAVGWVVIIESLIISALLLPMGAVADTLGRRRVYVGGLVVFGVGSIMSGLAPSFAALIAARIVMAIGNAGVQSVITGMLVAAFPPEERGRAMGAQTTAVSVGAACGPLIGGVALQVISWNTLFLLLGIPVAVSIVAALVILTDDRADGVGATRSLDGVGSVLSAATVVVLVFTISNPLAFNWLSAPMLVGALLVIGLLGAFVWWELRHDEPMIEVRFFAIPAFRWAVLVRFLGFTGYATTALLLPIYLVSFRGISEGFAGAVLFLIAAGTGISAQISGNLSDWIGPRTPTIFGLIGQILVAIVLVVFGEEISTGLLMLVVFGSGISSGLWNVPNNSAMMGAVPAESLGVIGAFTNVVRTMGSVLGQAIATAVVVAVMVNRGFDVPLSEIAETAGAGAAFFGGWSAAYAVVVVASLIALAAALRLPAHPIGVRPKETR